MGGRAGVADLIQRGDVRWYRFAQPDKRRPVVVLTRDSIIPHLGAVTVAPVTTVVRDIPSEALLAEGDGMPRACAVNLDHLQTVSRGKLEGLLTHLPARRMRQVRKALLFALGFDD
ncbi:MAG: type II toxin-antitoxin system PemK/MazF family toxin [Candidatus Latescibacterota bacterium]